MMEELVDCPIQEAGELQPLADVYREWELRVDDPRFCHVQSCLKIEKIRKVQAFVLLLLLEGSSVLLLARTGWGKSLIFQGLRYAALKESDRPQSRHITVVFVPLSGLGQEQVDEINEKAGSNVAIFYDKTKVHDRHLLDIRNGCYSWVFISPEKALHPQTMKMLWENVDFREKMLLFAVDEGHLVVEKLQVYPIQKVVAYMNDTDGVDCLDEVHEDGEIRDNHEMDNVGAAPDDPDIHHEDEIEEEEGTSAGYLKQQRNLLFSQASRE